MKLWISRIPSIMLLLGAIFGVILSVSGVSILWSLKPGIANQVSEGIDLIEQSLMATSSLLQVIDSSFASAQTNMDNIEKMTSDAALAMRNSDLAFNTVADLFGNDFAGIILDTQTSLKTAEASAQVIDDTLKIISLISSLNPFQSTPSYAPEVPLQTSIAQMSKGLDPLPGTLSKVQKELKSTSANLKSIQGSLNKLSGDVSSLKNNLSQAQDVMGQYNQIISELRPGVSTLKIRLLRWLDIIVWALTLIFVWMIFASLGLLMQGWDLLKRTTSNPAGPPYQSGN